MSGFPSAGDYREMLLDTTRCFPETHPFHGYEVERRDQVIYGRTGAFGIVFKLKRPGTQQGSALKCFFAQDPHRERRYEMIGQNLAERNDNWTVECRYRAEGIRDWADEFWPAVTMEWARGSSLIDWLEERAGDSAAVERCRLDFAKVMHSLHRRRIAHGDLQSKNILVEAGERIKLIDYDGMYIPGLDEMPPPEAGTRHFQRPGHNPEGRFNNSMDRFPARVIHLSLLAISAEPELWNELHGAEEDYLLLSERDLKEPHLSSSFTRLLASRSPHVRRETVQLLKDLDVNMTDDRIPLLDGLFTRSLPADSHRDPVTRIVPFVPLEPTVQWETTPEPVKPLEPVKLFEQPGPPRAAGSPEPGTPNGVWEVPLLRDVPARDSDTELEEWLNGIQRQTTSRFLLPPSGDDFSSRPRSWSRLYFLVLLLLLVGVGTGLWLLSFG